MLREMLLNETSSVHRWMVRWVRFSIRHPWSCAAGWILITLLALWSASHLTLKTDLAALLPRTYPSVREMDHLKQKVGGLEKVIFLIESPDSAANHRFAIDIGKRLRARPDISFVEWSQDRSFFDDRRLLYMDFPDLVEVYRRVSSHVQMDVFAEPLTFSDIEAKYQPKGPRRDEWASADGMQRLVMAYPAGASSNLTFSRAILRIAAQEVAALHPQSYNPRMKVSYGGEFKNRVDDYNVIRHDAASTAAISIIGIILLVSIYFRQIWAWLFIGYPLIAGLTWTFGITALAIGSLNLITAFLIAVLTGLGIDFGIHVFSRYTEERAHGHDLTEATTTAVTHTGAALVTSATTTVAAFYSLMITDFRGFSEFGFIAGTGILMTLGAVLLTFPAFITIGERLHLVRHQHRVRGYKRVDKPLPFYRPTLVVSTVVLGLCFLFAAIYPRIRFEYDFSRLRANVAASNEVKQKISAIRPQETAPAAVVVEDSTQRQEVARILRERMETDTLAPTITSVRTIESFLPDHQAQRMQLVGRLRRLVEGHEKELFAGQTQIDTTQLKKWLSVAPVTKDELPDYITRKFRGPDGSLGDFVMIGTSARLTDGKQAIAFAKDVQRVDTPDTTYYASGSAIIFANMLQVMEKDSAIAITITSIVVFGLILLDFKNLKDSLTVMVPLLAAMTFMLGIMALFGLKLNFYNMVALPSIVGMGVDNGVHLFHRYREEGRGTLRYIMKTTGGAVFMASLTTMVGFSGMLTATHQGLHSLGDASILGMFGVLVFSTTSFPMLLAWLEERAIRREGTPKPEEPHPQEVESGS